MCARVVFITPITPRPIQVVGRLYDIIECEELELSRAEGCISPQNALGSNSLILLCNVSTGDPSTASILRFISSGSPKHSL